MRRLSLASQRRYFALGVFGLLAASVYWIFFSAGIPVIWGPSASEEDIAAGRELFEHEWVANDPIAHGDGLGPVFNARSCAACHFQGGLGGGGELMHNAVAFEVHPRPGDPNFRTGTIHNFSVSPAHQESFALVTRLFPKIPGQTIRSSNNDPHCPSSATVTIPDFNPVRTESVQTTALFGAGWIDLISEKAIEHNRRKRLANNATSELKLDFGGVPVGKLRVLPDGELGRFGWKAQFASLSDFVAAACANELGLGTPDAEQARPLAAPDYTSEVDLDKKQFRSLLAFVKTLPKPVEVVPDNPTEQAAAAHGKELFTNVGCAACHVPNMGGVKGVYSDFLLYVLDDPMPAGGSRGGGGRLGSYGFDPPPQLQLPERPEEDAKPSEWKTPPLWGVADSAPYMHDGSAATLREAIMQHQGDAKSVTEKYQQLSASDQEAVLAFLKTLRAPPNAPPLRDSGVTRLARK